MKKKILGAFLTVAFFSSILGGCGRDALSESQDITVPEIAGTTESITTSTPMQATVDDTTEPTTEAQSDFDFEKTLEQTYICGHQLSYPLTWGQLGENFSVEPEGAVLSPQSGNLSCDVNYKGQYLGVITFKDCESVDYITENSEIFGILIQNSDIDKFDVPKISVYGVTLNDTHETLYEALGDSYTVRGLNDNVKYCEPDSKRQYDFIFNSMGEDKLVSVSIMNP